MKLNRLQQIVYNVIQQFPGVQDDDAALTAAVWRVTGWSDYATLEENVRLVARPESITRRRRELHQMGLITYSDKAMRRRTEAFINERDKHSKANWLKGERNDQ